MPKDEVNPLGPEHLTEIREKLEMLKEAERQVDRATLAGVDVGDAKLKISKLRVDLTKIKTVYFPNK